MASGEAAVDAGLMYDELITIQSGYLRCRIKKGEAGERMNPSEGEFGQWGFNDIFLSGIWNMLYSVVCPLWDVGVGVVLL